jgi:putative ABC transport system permease protein
VSDRASGAAVAAIARSELRRRWRALVVLGLIAGIAGGVVFGSLAVSRRTSTAFDRLLAETAPGDAVVGVFGTPEVGEAIRSLPVVESSVTADMFVFGVDADEVVYVALAAYSDPASPPVSPVVVEGRAFDPRADDEIVVDERFAGDADVHVGDQIPVKLLTPEEFGQFDTGFGEPDGPALTLEITGFVRWAGPADAFAPVLAGPGFAATYGEMSVGDLHAVELVGGASSADELEDELRTLAESVPNVAGREEFAPIDIALPEAERESLLPTTRTLVGGLLVFAGAAALVGLLALAQGFGRLQTLSASDQQVETALGLTSFQRVIARTSAALLAVAVAAVLAAVGTALAGRFEPMGAIEGREPSPGFAPNVSLVVLAVLVTATLVVAAAAVTAWRAGPRSASRQAVRPSMVADRLAAAGGAPPIVAGVRLALERGRGRSTVPVRSALVGAAVGVLGIGAAIVFSGSLDRLVDDPERWGAVADFAVVDVQDDTVAELAADERLTRVTESSDASVVVEGDQVFGYAFDAVKGDAVAWTLLEGRLPTAADDIVLGTRLADRLDVGVGGTVEIGVGDRAETFEVVGVGVGGYTNNEQLGVAVVMTKESMERVAVSESFREAFAVVDADEDAEAVAASYASRYEVSTRMPPVEVDSLDQLGALPEVFALFAGAMGVLAIGNGIVVAVRRRARDLGVMRTVGFTPRQTAGTVFTMAETSGAIAAIVGIPFGVAVGGAVWSAVAARAYVATDAYVPIPLMLALALATLAIVALVSTVPARRAARMRPADALRAE